MAVINGTEEKDTIIGTVDADVITALEKNDKIYGGDGNDTIDAGDGSDKVEGQVGDDSILGGLGKDDLKGNSGNDYIHGGEGKDRLAGGEDADTLNGGLGADKIYGGAGADVIYGGDVTDPADDKKDLIYGGEGADSIHGGAGNDRLMGDEGNDTIHGDDGDDKIDGGADNDSMLGGAGEDHLKGGAGDDIGFGGADDDTVRAGKGDDTLYGDGGDDSLNGGKGGDLIYGDSGDVAHALGGATRTNPNNDPDAGDDDIFGGHGADTIYGEQGDDEIDGHKGHDSIHGGEGNEDIHGGKGNDTLKGYLGDDFIDGEQHDDLFLHDLDWEHADSDVYEADHGIDTIRWYVTQDTWFSTELQTDRLGYLAFKDGVRSEDHDGEKDDDEITLTNWDLNLSGFEHLEIEVDTTDNGGGSFGVAGDYDTVTDVTDHDDRTDTQRKFYDNVAVYNNEVFLTDDDLNTGHDDVGGLGTVIREDSATVWTFDGTVLDNDTIEDWILELRVDTAGVLGNLDVTNFDGDEINPQNWENYGLFTYEVNGAFEHLSLNETATDNFTYTVKDASFNVNGDQDTATVTITITGDNDVITAGVMDLAGSVEDGVQTTDTGNMIVDDVDLNDNHLWTFKANGLTTLAGTFGTFTLVDNEAGVSNGSTNADWTYVLDTADADYILLDAGDTVTESAVVEIDDQNGDTHEVTVEVTVTGINDAPVTVDGTLPTVVEGSDDTLDLTTLASDPDDDTDPGDLTYSKVGGTGTTYATVAGGGTLIFDANHADFDFLAVGETTTRTVTFKANDGALDSNTSTVTVTITGINDAVSIVGGPDTGTVSEDGTLTDTGSFTETDADTSDTHTWAVQGGGVGTYGTLVIDGSGNWTYTLNNGGAATQALNGGTSDTDVFTVEVDDGNGSTDTETVTITVNGANDDPVMGAGVLAVNEGSVGSIVGGVTSTDVDTGATATYTKTGNGTGAAYATVGAGGSFDFDASHADFDDLAVGEDRVLTVEVQVEDDHTATDTNDVTVTVTGINDGPTMAAGADTVGESGSSTIDLTLLGDDIDSDDDGDSLTYTHVVKSYEVNGGAVALPGAALLSINGSKELVFDTNGAFEDLDLGDTGELVVTVTAEDAHGDTASEDITITINGENDAPSFTSLVAQSTDEGDNDTFFFTSSDVDGDDVATTETYAITGGTGIAYATLVDANTGEYTFDATHADFNGLDGVSSTTRTLEVSVTDGDGAVDTQTVTFTINGVNDAPVAAADGTTHEGDFDATAGGTITLNLSDLTSNDSDVDDLAASLAISTIAAATTTHGLTVTHQANGAGVADDTIEIAVTGGGAFAVADNYSDSFTYSVEDDEGAVSNVATVTFMFDII